MPAPGSTEASGGRPQDAALEDLRTADLVIEGRMPWSSNATFLCELWPAGQRPDAGLDEGDEDDDVEDGAGTLDDTVADDDLYDDVDAAPRPSTKLPGGGGPLGRAIYKPHQGERPLWDFPDGLYRREAGAYLLADALGWDCIPPTIVRDDAPFGPGSVQLFVDADFDQHHFTLVEDEAFHPQLRRLCAFDVVANSTDRKSGHVLADDDGHLWGIDNALCLHAEFKLRTVIWEFATEPLPSDLADDLDRFVSTPLPAGLCDLLDPFERDALITRARALLTEGRFPIDPTGRRYPWPLV